MPLSCWTSEKRIADLAKSLDRIAAIEAGEAVYRYGRMVEMTAEHKSRLIAGYKTMIRVHRRELRKAGLIDAAEFNRLGKVLSTKGSR